MSPRTVEAYTDAVRFLALYCEAHGHPILAGELRRTHIQDFIADQLARWKPATAHNRYRGLHAFHRWLEEDDDLPSPMGKMKPPAVPDQPVPVLTEPQLRALFAVCSGKDFEARRDTALALDRDMRVRSRHRLAHLDALWISQRGPRTISGLRDRGRSDAHRWLAVPRAACPLWRLGRRCACPRCAPSPFAERSAVAAGSPNSTPRARPTAMGPGLILQPHLLSGACPRHVPRVRSCVSCQGGKHPTGGSCAGDAVPPETRYARVGPNRLAYQVLGQGPPDLVLTIVLVVADAELEATRRPSRPLAVLLGHRGCASSGPRYSA